MKANTTGGYDNRVSSAKPRTCHSICVTARAVGLSVTSSSHARDYCSVFRTPRSAPHFTTHRVSNHDRTCAVDRAAIKRPKTRADLVTGGRTPRLSRTDAVRVWGSPWIRREPPENWVVGCETSRGRRTHDIGFQSSTIDTYTLQDFLHFYDKPYGSVSR